MTQVKYLSKFILMFVLASFLGCASTSKPAGGYRRIS